MNTSIVETQSIVLAIGYGAQTKDYIFDLPDDKKKVIGFYLIRNTGASYLKVGVRDQNGKVLVRPTNISFLEAGANIKISDRFFKEIQFEAAGKKVIVSVQNFAVIAGVDESIDVLYLCSNE